MTILKDLALAGFQMEKEAGLSALKDPKYWKMLGKEWAPAQAAKIKSVAKSAGPGAVAGAAAGYVAGKSSQTKQAGLLGIAKDFASTAKGVGSVAKNLVKQNPTVAKAAIGGAVAGAAATKVMSGGQNKQAAAKDPGLAKEEKDDAGNGKFNASPGAAAGDAKAGKSSLIAAAKAEMAKPA